MAWYKNSVANFLHDSPDHVLNQLAARSAERYQGDQRAQMRAWSEQLRILRDVLQNVVSRFDFSARWGLVIEYPLLRLQKRLDVVLLAGDLISVVEFKVGADDYLPQDSVQAVDYCMDLRDFHAASHAATLLPILCATNAGVRTLDPIEGRGLLGIRYVNGDTLRDLMSELALRQSTTGAEQIDLEAWTRAPYRPVPTIIEAAELLYAEHDVAEIAHAAADVQNLTITAARIVENIRLAREQNRKVICFITGVPGSGKTLVGLNAVHDAGVRHLVGRSSAFLSGNTPLVFVLREALACDTARRTDTTLRDARQAVKSEIQGLMSFLEQYLEVEPDRAPHEHVVIFDEAQRAWDAEYGQQRFNRAASEPSLFLEIMGRHTDWAVIIALVGNGQEINRGEQGLQEWGKALTDYHVRQQPSWDVVAPPAVLTRGSAQWQSLFQEQPYPGVLRTDADLHLRVSIRSHTCEVLHAWIDAVLKGDMEQARNLTASIDQLPVRVTRSLTAMRAWLKSQALGHRRSGLVASSGARRLRADGLGVSLNAQELNDVVHWYLKPQGDVRSSCALEITANEYTCQGLELDYVGMCWGGDLNWNTAARSWEPKTFSGTRWQRLSDENKRNYILNKYRVLLSRARCAMLVWVPEGDTGDTTRSPADFDATYNALCAAGVEPLEPSQPLSKPELLLGRLNAAIDHGPR